MKKYKILIAEDEVIIAMELKRNMENHGYLVCPIASTADEAIKLAEQCHPDIILMDVLLKDQKTGIQAAQTICKKNKIPTIYMTGNVGLLNKNKGLPCYPFKVISKPPSDIQLLQLIKELLSGGLS